ncbi:MAG: hypothetical protein CVU89_10075 [Firmicutes bacterium HGW-Firmicutes-14]|nr:MAG: hypothetical protein CVU89_10075 [Firmicutes bacterium HGW-Firmicutes-14]
MPKCARCGNTFSFGCSRVPPVAPEANGPVSGLIANFDDKGHITEMESIGADLDTAQEAWERPVDYFDTCYECGSDNIVW